MQCHGKRALCSVMEKGEIQSIQEWVCVFVLPFPPSLTISKSICCEEIMRGPMFDSESHLSLYYDPISSSYHTNTFTILTTF